MRLGGWGEGGKLVIAEGVVRLGHRVDRAEDVRGRGESGTRRNANYKACVLRRVSCAVCVHPPVLRGPCVPCAVSCECLGSHKSARKNSLLKPIPKIPFFGLVWFGRPAPLLSALLRYHLEVVPPVAAAVAPPIDPPVAAVLASPTGAVARRVTTSCRFPYYGFGTRQPCPAALPLPLSWRNRSIRCTPAGRRRRSTRGQRRRCI